MSNEILKKLKMLNNLYVYNTQKYLYMLASSKRFPRVIWKKNVYLLWGILYPSEQEQNTKKVAEPEQVPMSDDVLPTMTTLKLIAKVM